MALITCKLCGKIFTAVGARTCPDCLKRLDDLYPTVREYLRNNPKSSLNVESLATEIDVDVRDVQALVDMGYLDRDMDRSSLTSGESDRQKLAREFEQSLNQMKASTASRASASKGPVTYAQELYNKSKKR